jgi:hypothetical protein
MTVSEFDVVLTHWTCIACHFVRICVKRLKKMKKDFFLILFTLETNGKNTHCAVE